MTEPGVFAWTSPLGYSYLRDHTGSRATGRAWPEPGTDTPPGRVSVEREQHDPSRAHPPDQ
jgi:hypothetical protein